MRKGSAQKIAVVLSVPLILISIAAAISDQSAAALINVAALIYLAVLAAEALNRRQAPVTHSATPPAGDPSTASRIAHDRLNQQLQKVLAFVASNTPNIATDSKTRNPAVLNVWLDTLSARLARPTSMAAGAMIAREQFTLDSEELEPFCEIRYSGGSNQCILPPGSRIPIKAGVAWDIAQGVGARSIFIAKTSLNDHRYWICVTFVGQIDHPLLQSLPRIAVAPVTLALQYLEGSVPPHDIKTDFQYESGSEPR